MDWNSLLCESRRSGSPRHKTDERNEFQRDYHRIVGSASFRRLQDKTQVFPLDNSDFVRTRLTHSLEVSSFAKSLGQSSFLWLKNNRGRLDNLPDDSQTVKICNILECAGLLHDIGNPPFGHFGEYSIRNWFAERLDSLTSGGKRVCDILSEQMKNDLLHFEGNAQALRLLTKLHFLVDENGMHLTYGLLNSIVKYPVSSLEIDACSGNIRTKKMGYYLSEQELFAEISAKTGALNRRYPLVYLLEAADDIAYSTADIEDAVKKGFISYTELVSELKSKKYRDRASSQNELDVYDSAVKKLEELYERARSSKTSNPQMNAVQNWIIYVHGVLLRGAQFGFTSNYQAIMDGSYDREVLAAEGCTAAALIGALKNIAVRYVFQSSYITQMELSASTIISFFLDRFVPAAIKYDSGEKLNAVEERYMRVISDNYMKAYRFAARDKSEAERLYLRLLLVTDYICGMTDSYAKNLYQKLNGIAY